MAINPILPAVDVYEFGGMGTRSPEPIVVTAPAPAKKSTGKSKPKRSKKEAPEPVAVSYDGGATWITPAQANAPVESTDGGKTWTPVATTPPPPARAQATPSGYDVNRGLQIMDAIMNQYPGINPDDAAAVAGNFLYESYGLPNIYEGQNPSNAGTYVPDTGGFGVAQWTGPRRRALMEMPNPQSLDTQIQYFAQENAGPEASAWQSVLAAPDLAAKTETFAREWERPGVPAIPRRVALANEVSDAYYNRNLDQQRQIANTLGRAPIMQVPVVRPETNLDYNLLLGGRRPVATIPTGQTVIPNWFDVLGIGAEPTYFE